MAIDWKSAYASLQKSAEAEFPPACLHYLLQVLRTVQPANAEKKTTPMELTSHFRRQSRKDFGPLLPMVLQEWRMAGPAEFGRGMVLLGRMGCLNLEPSDTLESFIGDDPRTFLDA